jgi:MoxR-like ATPase
VNIQVISEIVGEARREVSRALMGHDDAIEQTLIAVLARGHVLVESVPGLGKTLLVRALAQVLGCSFRRIQFTPDLMPSDVTGGNVFNQRSNAFEFAPGPVFTQLLLADEINRAPPKTQAALLEAMQDRSVTTDGTSRTLPQPFFVIATQNPIESQGTYPLPEAQLDRFLFKIYLKHPSPETERQILANHLAGFDSSSLESFGLRRLVSADQLVQMQAAVSTVRADEGIVHYVADLIDRTRKHRSIALGASTRSAVALLQAARARAAFAGRDYVVPDDVKELTALALRHRILLQPDAELEGVATDDALGEILREAPVPRSAA